MTGPGVPIPDEAVARAFHEAYERLAPNFGYKTREASAVPWEQVAEANRRLMIAVAGEVAPLAVAAQVAALCPEPGTIHVGDHCDYVHAAAVLTARAAALEQEAADGP